jgi:hypothetical protein
MLERQAYFEIMKFQSKSVVEREPRACSPSIESNEEQPGLTRWRCAFEAVDGTDNSSQRRT